MYVIVLMCMLPKQRQKNAKKAERNRNAYVSAVHVDLVSLHTNYTETTLVCRRQVMTRRKKRKEVRLTHLPTL